MTESHGGSLVPHGKSEFIGPSLRYASRSMTDPNDGIPSAPVKQPTGSASPFRPAPISPENNGTGLKIAAGVVAVLVIGLLIAGWLRASVARQRNEAIEIVRQAQQQIEQRRAREPENLLQPTTVQAPVVPVAPQGPSPALVAAMAIESTMRTRVEQVGRRCFSIIEESDPSAYGQVSMRVSINPSTGVVDIARLNHGSLPTSFVGCFRSAVERPPIAIPPGASAGAAVEVRFSLDYGHPPLPH